MEKRLGDDQQGAEFRRSLGGFLGVQVQGIITDDGFTP